MKKIVVGTIALSLIFSQGLMVADAAGKDTKKSKVKKVVIVDKDKNGIADNWQKKYRLGNGKSVAVRDNDGDGLINLQEYQLSLNPTLKDTDKDKLPDGQEDFDKDQLTNLQDIQAKLSPTNADTDKDGLKDSAEDNDKDDLTTKEEYLVGTNPIKIDSDQDKIIDGEEDKDNDQLDNSLEFDLGYNPNKKDSDNDGLQDSKEDIDNDGVINANEMENLVIKVKEAKDKRFKLNYKINKKELKMEIEDSIGIKDAKTIMDLLTITPNMTDEELITEVTQALGISTFAEIEIEVKFVKGKKLKAKEKLKVYSPDKKDKIDKGQGINDQDQDEISQDQDENDKGQDEIDQDQDENDKGQDEIDQDQGENDQDQGENDQE